jgi:hypothetical protein
MKKNADSAVRAPVSWQTGLRRQFEAVVFIAEVSAAEGPLLGRFHQASLYRIRFDVASDLALVRLVAELHEARHVEVRQVTARMPAAKVEFRSFGIGWTVPLPFVTNGLKDVAAIRGHRSADSFVRANRRAKRIL